jgi:hypothetical protein
MLETKLPSVSPWKPSHGQSYSPAARPTQDPVGFLPPPPRPHGPATYPHPPAPGRGHPWSPLTTALSCSSAAIVSWQQRFAQDPVPGLVALPPGLAPRWPERWCAVVVDCVLGKRPRDLGFLRSRWCCGMSVLLFGRLHQTQLSRATGRRWLHPEQIECKDLFVKTFQSWWTWCWPGWRTASASPWTMPRIEQTRPEQLSPMRGPI